MCTEYTDFKYPVYLTVLCLFYVLKYDYCKVPIWRLMCLQCELDFTGRSKTIGPIH